MNYILEKQIDALMEQRKSLLKSIENLDEHTQNFSVKEATLNNQVITIDGNINMIISNLERTPIK